ncbi:MAG: hypothetical protein Q8P07_00670 [bacterium]|nr:hypothetical protein [bacterium]
MAECLFEDGNESRRKLIGNVLREATSAQLLRARGLIESKTGETLGYFILRRIAEKALELFDKAEFEHPKVCWFFVKYSDEFRHIFE